MTSLIPKKKKMMKSPLNIVIDIKSVHAIQFDRSVSPLFENQIVDSFKEAIRLMQYIRSFERVQLEFENLMRKIALCEWGFRFLYDSKFSV